MNESMIRNFNYVLIPSTPLPSCPFNKNPNNTAASDLTKDLSSLLLLPDADCFHYKLSISNFNPAQPFLYGSQVNPFLSLTAVMPAFSTLHKPFSYRLFLHSWQMTLLPAL